MNGRYRVARRLFLCAVVLGLVFTGAASWATDATAAIRAARLTYLAGTVTVDPGDKTGAQPAQLNLPLLAGVRLATGEDGQAEVEFEDGSLVRLTPNSALSLDTLSVDAGAGSAPGVFTTALKLLRGLAYVELRATAQYVYIVDAGGDVLSPVENTTVRIDFDEPPAVFAVLDGAARVGHGGGFSREVRAGESLRGDPADPAGYSLTAQIAEDSWDQWNEDRDQAAMAEAASRTAARDNFAGAQGFGWADLDANGSWYDVPGEGPIWQPEVASTEAGFDPYANGAWVSGYGWGWTPYRCGSWSYWNGFGWGWSPGGGCGGLGWAFAGGGGPVNIGHWPNWYKVPHSPVRPPGPVHPIVPGRLAEGSQGYAEALLKAPAGFAPAARRINGVTVLPVEPVGSGYTTRGGNSVASSLERDFPVDATTHVAIAGRPSTQPAVVRTASGWQPSTARGVPSRTSYPAAIVNVNPAYRGGSSAAAAARGVAPSGAAGQTPHPANTPAPVQRSSPAPAPAPRAAPAPAPAPAPAAVKTSPR